LKDLISVHVDAGLSSHLPAQMIRPILDPLALK